MQKLVYPSLRDGLVAAWCPSVDRSRSTLLTDLSGYGNNGTLTNMDPGTDWVASDGKIALDFDGVDDYINVPDSQSVRPDKFTICSWVYSKAAGATYDNQPIATRGNNPWSWYLTVGGQKVNVFHDGPNVWLSGNTTLSLNNWAFVAATYDGANIKVWLNGLEDNSVADTIATEYSSQAMKIGQRVDNGETFNGQIDDVRLYNRALSPSEISLLAQRRGIGYETYRVPVARGAVAGGVTVTPTTVALTATKFAPTVLTPQTVTPPTEVLGAIGFAPTVTATSGATVTPVTAVLGATGFAPTVTICTPRSVTADTIQIRRGTVGCWTNVNPVLADGEFGLETDTRRMKIGDGATVYKSLAYITRASVRKTANYTLAIYDRGVFVDATGGAVTITLPTATSAKHVDFFVKKIDSSGNTVTIDAAGAETIDGALTQVISTQYTTVSIYSDATSWHVI